MASTNGRNTLELANGGRLLVVPVAAKTVIYGGTLVALDANGNAIPAKKATDLVVIGRAEETADNATGAVGDSYIKVKRGVFLWGNDTTDKITQADLMKKCYALDDCTVTSLATGTSVAGKVIAVTDEGIYVETI